MLMTCWECSSKFRLQIQSEIPTGIASDAVSKVKVKSANINKASNVRLETLIAGSRIWSTCFKTAKSR